MANYTVDTATNKIEATLKIVAIPQSIVKGYGYVIAAVICVFFWVLWTSNLDSGLYGDNVEQLIWVHSLEWGYYKHPPLPTWLLAAALSLVGPHWWITNALAAICLATTGALTWLIARRLAGQSIANMTIVLWGLQQCFSVSAEIYNHNTVLVMCLAATTYCLIRALQASQHPAWYWWLATGALAALAMLTKYQAALPLLALSLAALIIAKRRRLSIGIPIAIALSLFVVMLSPHLYWGYTHQFPTLSYASKVIESDGFFRRIFWQLTFAVNQIRLNLPLIGALLLSWLIVTIWSGQQSTSVQGERGSKDLTSELKVWLWALIWGPLAAVLAFSIVTGNPLRNHWGVQLFQFFPLWIAAYCQNRKFLQPKPLVIAAILVHGLGLSYYAIKQSDPEAVLATRRADSAYPARKMADAALGLWNSATSCPLKIVAGDFEAGLVSAFSKGFPMIWTTPVETPWLSQADVVNLGALYVYDSMTALPADVILKTNWPLANAKDGTQKYVQLAVRLPSQSCAPMGVTK